MCASCADRWGLDPESIDDLLAAAGMTYGDVMGGVALAVLFIAGLWVVYGTGLSMCVGCW